MYGEETLKKPGSAYKRLRIFPKQKKLNSTNEGQDLSVSCDTRLGSKTKEI